MTQLSFFEIEYKPMRVNGYEQGWMRKCICAENSNEYRRKLRAVVRGSEDWCVREISGDAYRKAMNL